ncbi:hypothetical protein ANO14919_069980 [Xylariales sp. No.14919]|nr:hypothetical protein ANO14919_069980 [Xylariales sp. No.14919]
MAGSSSPRSVADATRFTANRPHANAKSPAGRPSGSPNAAAASLPRRGGVGGVAAGAAIPQETLDERVRRLRAAHLAAKQHSVSRMDQIIGGSRRLFDAAHKFTVMGLIGFSGIALLVTVYATADMMVYNRQRRNEFFALQKRMREDSLEAARLAYIAGTASDEQVALVEDATARARESGLSLPSILSAPRPAESDSEAHQTQGGTAAAPEEKKKKAGGITGWLFGGLKREEETVTTDRWGDDAAAAAHADPAGSLRDKAQAAFDQERDAQRRGGPLDQVGLDSRAPEDKKKGWLW